MMKVVYCIPTGTSIEHMNYVVPRIGEHVMLHEILYLVFEVRHFPEMNVAWVGLKNIGK